MGALGSRPAYGHALAYLQERDWEGLTYHGQGVDYLKRPVQVFRGSDGELDRWLTVGRLKGTDRLIIQTHGKKPTITKAHKARTNSGRKLSPLRKRKKAPSRKAPGRLRVKHETFRGAWGEMRFLQEATKIGCSVWDSDEVMPKKKWGWFIDIFPSKRGGKLPHALVKTYSKHPRFEAGDESWVQLGGFKSKLAATAEAKRIVSRYGR